MRTRAALQLSASPGDGRFLSQCWQTQLPRSSLWPGSFLAFDKLPRVTHWPAVFIYSASTGSSIAVSHAVQFPGTQRCLNMSLPFSGSQSDGLRFAKRIQNPLARHSPEPLKCSLAVACARAEAAPGWR